MVMFHNQEVWTFEVGAGFITRKSELLRVSAGINGYIQDQKVIA